MDCIGDISSLEGQGTVMEFACPTSGGLLATLHGGGISVLSDHDGQNEVSKRCWIVPPDTGQAYRFTPLGLEA